MVPVNTAPGFTGVPETPRATSSPNLSADPSWLSSEWTEWMSKGLAHMFFSFIEEVRSVVGLGGLVSASSIASRPATPSNTADNPVTLSDDCKDS